jgi:hypothetical protein
MDATDGSLRSLSVGRGTSDSAASKQICIHHGGRNLRTTSEQAGVFLRRVRALIDRGRSELVPLLHDDGIDLLYIAASTPLLVHDVRDHSCDGGHAR